MSDAKPMKVMAVEDDAVARRILTQALVKLGHEVVEAEDGEAAWELWQAEKTRIIVSDWLMPKMDGLGLCERLRSLNGPDYVYFILLTGSEASIENKRMTAEAGVDDFLTKPLDFQELWMRMRVAERIVRTTQQVRQLEELLPICSYCKKIRDDQNYWQQIEGYINERTGSEFSHSVCPDCYTRVVLPELENLRKSMPVPQSKRSR